MSLASLSAEQRSVAAYYLKELSKSGLRRELFLLALEEQRVAGNLWWPVRALDELGYEKELTALVLDNEAQIHELQNPILEYSVGEGQGGRPPCDRTNEGDCAN